MSTYRSGPYRIRWSETRGVWQLLHKGTGYVCAEADTAEYLMEHSGDYIR